VVCRNLLIYFKPELQQDLLDLFAYSLQQTSGYLFLGKAETARPARGSFDLVNKKWKVYRCVSGPVAAPLTARPHAAHERVRRAGEPVSAETVTAPAEPIIELLHLRRLNELVLRHLPTGVVLLDRAYRILSLNTMARRLLGIREPATEQDFLHTVRALPYAAVRDAVDAAFASRSASTVADVAVESVGGQTRFVTLHVAPVQSDVASVDTAVVSITDTSDFVDLRRRVEAAEKEQRQLVEELGGSNARLKRANDELQEANEELQGANEELLLAQEELQATNEEFEATNEELQATNEELETNNEELQATNEELEATNEELGARTAELQEMTNSLALERARLGEMVNGGPFSIVVLRGAGLQVEAANANATMLLGSGLVGRTLDEICTSDELLPVLAGAREAYAKDSAWSNVGGLRSPPVDAPAALAFTAMPTHDAAGGVTGVVLYGHRRA
jgi:two-component system CheB/CheR fusion protein